VSVPAHATRLWRTLAGREDAFAAGSRHVTRGSRGFSPPGWIGVVRLGDAVVIEAADAADEDVSTLLSLEDPTDPDAVDDALAPAERLGPAELAYLDGAATSGIPDAALDVHLDRQPVRRLAAWLRTAPPADLEESSIAEMHDVVVAFVDGRPVGAAGHLTWPTGIAHLGMLVDRDARGRGVGRALASAATRWALDHDLHPQWRAASANVASRALARRVGYREVGRQLSVRLGPGPVGRCS
jgi:GNAT superfamily N-acetyltransferase